MTLISSRERENHPVTVARRLKEEIDSWRPYAEALRQEDREVFREMMNSVAACTTKQSIGRNGVTTLKPS